MHGVELCHVLGWRPYSRRVFIKIILEQYSGLQETGKAP